MQRFLLLIFVFINISISFAQGSLPPGTYTSTNKKAIKYFEESKKMFYIRKDVEAEKLIKKAIEEDPQFIEAHSAYADFLMGKNRIKEAIIHYEKAIQINPKLFVDNHFYLGGAYLHEGLYDKAIPCFELIEKTERINPTLKEDAARYLKNAQFGANAIKNPKPFKPVNVGEGINTSGYEYFPALTADGNTFMFTRDSRTKNNNDPGLSEDFYISKKVNGIWQTAYPITSVNSIGNEGAPTLSVDGQFMFFASCIENTGEYADPQRKGFGSCDIFYAQKIDGKWSKPQNVGPPINTRNWETQPSFSSDGKTLYFIRGFISRDGNIKSEDIYMSVIGADGKFGEPIKLSDNINTPYKEESVYIHPDNQTLYFSSTGHPGMGGVDLFMSKREADGSWGKAINLGYPINTFSDENSLLVDANGKLAYFASEREGGFGGLDIYQFELPESVRPEKITYVKGLTYNAKTKVPVDASFELIDLETQQSVTSAYSNSAGEFLVTLTSNHNYLVNVSKPGFLFYSDNFSLKDKVADYNKPYKLQIPLQPIDTGIIELKNIFFDVNKWDLKAESKAELQKIITFLKANPTLKIEFSGHTDNSGDKVFNKTLSTNRAKAIYDYVIEKGSLPAANLSYKGYGDTKPKAPNDTPENKAKNRRTELKVLSK